MQPDDHITVIDGEFGSGTRKATTGLRSAGNEGKEKKMEVSIETTKKIHSFIPSSPKASLYHTRCSSTGCNSFRCRRSSEITKHLHAKALIEFLMDQGELNRSFNTPNHRVTWGQVGCLGSVWVQGA